MESDQFITLGIGGLGIDKLQGILRVDMKIKCYNFAHGELPVYSVMSRFHLAG